MVSHETVQKDLKAVVEKVGVCGLISEGKFDQEEHADGEFKMGWVLQGPTKKGDPRKIKGKGGPQKINSLLGKSSLGARKGEAKKGTWTRRVNRATESSVSVESEDFLCSKRKTSVILGGTQVVGDTNKKAKLS